ncbi:hypothetical protein LCGC14_2354330 [marine sediment metagenome]|uniref:Uncharacterized protein n=1 Tax=marine sediment metagenome TaxID=412755 RepID=A0A0F9C8R4_9ZZZZ
MSEINKVKTLFLGNGDDILRLADRNIQPEFISLTIYRYGKEAVHFTLSKENQEKIMIFLKEKKVKEMNL